jgi:hypothetical protein
VSQVQLFHVNPVEALELKRELLITGLKMEDDFTWRYQQVKHDDFSFQSSPSSVTFNFKDPALATFYNLKWANTHKRS